MEQSTQKTPKQLMAITDLLSEAKEFLLKKKEVILPLALIPGFFWYISSVFSDSIISAPIALLSGLIGLVLSLISSIAIIRVLEAKNDQKEWKYYFGEAKNNFLPLLFLVVLLAVVISVGYLFLVLPGIYLSVVLSFSVVVHVLEGKKAWKAAERSMELAKGHFSAIFFRILALALVIVVASMLIVLVIGILSGGNKWIIGLGTLVIQTILSPYAITVIYKLYKELV